MSMQRGCAVIERTPGRWYCVVATEEYDYDFRQATKYGPAKTSDAAVEMMDRHECNPGGYTLTGYDQITEHDKALCDRLPDQSTRQRYPTWVSYR